MPEPVSKRLLPLLFFLALVLPQPGCQKEPSNKPEGRPSSAQVAESPAATANDNESVYETVLRKLKKNPDNVRAIYHLADLYYRDGQYEKAVENYRKVISRKPNRGFVYMRMGTSLNQLQRYEEALAAFQQAIPKLSDPAVAYNNMGITYGKLGRYQEEIASLRNAIKHRPRYASALFNLGVTLLRVGDPEGARRQYEALNEFDLTMARALLTEIDRAESGQYRKKDG